MSEEVTLVCDSNGITWFSNSPDAGDPRCTCSWCAERIEEEHAPAIRMFDSIRNMEARFHHGCYGAALKKLGHTL